MALRILILHSHVPQDAQPDELDTLIQARWVAEILTKKGHLVTVEPFRSDPIYVKRLLHSVKPSCLFNLVETVEGSGKYSYLAAEFCEKEGIPYTGSSARAIFVTSNKCMTKQMLASKGLPVPRTLWPSGEKEDVSRVLKAIVKPLWEDGSVGLTAGSVIDFKGLNITDLSNLNLPYSLSGEFFIEEYVDGREFNVSLIDWQGSVRVLPVAEIVFEGYEEGEPKILDYEAKWHPESPSYRRTLRRFGLEEREPGLAGVLRELSLFCWEILELRGYARVDFRVDNMGQPWIIEVNANPCLSPDAGFMAAVREAGISPEEAIEAIVESALRGR